MLEQLKQEVFEANLLLPRYQLITFTWGNVSGIDRERGFVVIKPSGVVMKRCGLRYGHLRLERERRGKGIISQQRSDDAFGAVPALCACGRHRAYSFAERDGLGSGGKSDPALGTTHGDYFYGPIPCALDAGGKSGRITS